MIDHNNKEREKERIGDIIHIILLQCNNIITRFSYNFIPSTIDCNKPNQPTRLGAILLWTAPITQRSNKTK